MTDCALVAILEEVAHARASIFVRATARTPGCRHKSFTNKRCIACIFVAFCSAVLGRKHPACDGKVFTSARAGLADPHRYSAIACTQIRGWSNERTAIHGASSYLLPLRCDIFEIASTMVTWIDTKPSRCGPSLDIINWPLGERNRPPSGPRQAGRGRRRREHL